MPTSAAGVAMSCSGGFAAFSEPPADTVSAQGQRQHCHAKKFLHALTFWFNVKHCAESHGVALSALPTIRGGGCSVAMGEG